MPDIYWRHELYEGDKAFYSAWKRANLFSVPKSLFSEMGEPFRSIEDNLVYLCILHGDKVWAARSVSPMPAQNTDRLLINCVDVSSEPFAKQILMKKLLSS